MTLAVIRVYRGRGRLRAAEAGSICKGGERSAEQAEFRKFQGAKMA